MSQDRFLTVMHPYIISSMRIPYLTIDRELMDNQILVLLST